MLSACASTPRVYTGLASGEQVNFKGLMQGIDNHRVVFIGEAHDSTRDHAVQFSIIRSLVESGQKVSVAMEMFTPSAQGALNAWTEGRLSELSFYDWYTAGWEMPYGLYRDIFLYARQHSIPLYGINADRRLIISIAQEGLGSIPANVLQMIKFTPCSSEPEYASAIGMAGILDEHGGGMSHLCNAQRFRDSMLAYNISRILSAEHEGVLVVLLGTGHALKQAVPSILSEHTNASYIVLLPGEVRFLSGHAPGLESADFIW